MSAATRNRHPEVPWRKMWGLASFAKHAYRQVDSEIRALCPQSIRTSAPPLPDAKGREVATVIAWVAAPTLAELDDVAARIARVPGVSQVYLWFPRSTLPIRTWLNERIETTWGLSRLSGVN